MKAIASNVDMYCIVVQWRSQQTRSTNNALCPAQEINRPVTFSKFVNKHAVASQQVALQRGPRAAACNIVVPALPLSS